MATKTTSISEVTILEVDKGEVEFCILGTSPLIMNRMSQKALHELLAPRGRKTTAEKASSLKHDPVREFRDSPYVLDDELAPTKLAVLSTAFKGSMVSAALDLPDVKSTQIKRLVWVDGIMIPVYGIPKLFMAVTRSADINKTPDVRTRSILPEWACRVKVSFLKPMLREQSIANLLAAAGFQSGIGDWRQEKGSGSFGAFKLVSADDPDFNRIIDTQGRAEQEAALERPQAYNSETEELLAWFHAETQVRGFKVTK